MLLCHFESKCIVIILVFHNVKRSLEYFRNYTFHVEFVHFSLSVFRFTPPRSRVKIDFVNIQLFTFFSLFNSSTSGKELQAPTVVTTIDQDVEQIPDSYYNEPLCLEEGLSGYTQYLFF